MPLRPPAIILTSLMLSPLMLSACGEPNSGPDAELSPPAAEETAMVSEPVGPEIGSLEWALAGEWRGEQGARDAARNPAETLSFFEVDPASTVMEIWPGGGWYANILAPWVENNGGRYIAAWTPVDPQNDRAAAFRDAFTERMSAEPFGEIELTSFGPETGPIAEAGSIDTILTFRNAHSWMGRGMAEKAFADFHAALKPGGHLGLVAHRLPATREQDPRASSGYVQQDYVIALATEAGFELVNASEINANPADTADHPFGVWTLPPVLRSAPRGEPTDPEFDQTPYLTIGESDRMTLLFRKRVDGLDGAETDAE
ncbi:MAG: methyltransferase [Pseudomonadota bacterium]